MNEVKFSCGHCGQRIETDEQLSGRTVLCPSCDEHVVVPKKSVRLDPATATIVADLDDSSPRLENTDESERAILEVRPSPRAFLGRIAFAIALPAVVLALVITFRLWTRIESSELFMALVLAPVIVCAVILLSVWLHTVSFLYTLTTERIFVRRGLLAKRIEEVELFRVKDVKMAQTALQRILGYGDVTVYSSDDSMPVFHIQGISRPVEIKEELRASYRAARKREKVTSTEFIPS